MKIKNISACESLIEILIVMQDFPDLEKDFEEAELALKSGEYKQWTKLDSLLRQHNALI